MGRLGSEPTPSPVTGTSTHPLHTLFWFHCNQGCCWCKVVNFAKKWQFVIFIWQKTMFLQDFPRVLCKYHQFWVSFAISAVFTLNKSVLIRHWFLQFLKTKPILKLQFFTKYKPKPSLNLHTSEPYYLAVRSPMATGQINTNLYNPAVTISNPNASFLYVLDDGMY